MDHLMYCTCCAIITVYIILSVFLSFSTSVMISTVMCSREMLRNTQCNSHIPSPVRIEPRRNSIPPTQTLTAKHLLAYLPRPQPESSRHTHKVQLSILYDVIWGFLEFEKAVFTFIFVLTLNLS